MNIYLTDAVGIYTGTFFEIVDPQLALPRGVTDEPPLLSGDEVAQWVGNSWVVLPSRPVEPTLVPASVSRFQAMAALHLAGHLENVEAIMANPTTPVLTKLAWNNALNFDRGSETLASLASMLALSDADLDNLFITAAGIQA